jgi:hypothetical protein
MKYTNRLGLPEPLANAVKNDTYDAGEDTDYSVTQLIDPPRKIALERENEEALTEDVADAIFRLLGQAVHTILERAGVPERRFAITVLGKTISGKIDRFKDGLLQDWKVTTAYRFKDGKVPADVEAQLNCYAEILRQNGKKVERLEAVGILRDWSKLEVLRGGGEYPPNQVAIVQVPLWPSEHAKAFLEGRVRLHEAAKEKLPECSAGERWARPDTYAVRKPGMARSVRNLPSLKTAEEFIAMQKKDKEKLSVEFRAGESIRCKAYCAAAPFCLQWKKLQRESIEPPPTVVAAPTVVEVSLTSSPEVLVREKLAEPAPKPEPKRRRPPRAKKPLPLPSPLSLVKGKKP